MAAGSPVRVGRAVADPTTGELLPVLTDQGPPGTAPYLRDEGGHCRKDQEREERNEARGRREAPQVVPMG